MDVQLTLGSQKRSLCCPGLTLINCPHVFFRPNTKNVLGRISVSTKRSHLSQKILLAGIAIGLYANTYSMSICKPKDQSSQEEVLKEMMGKKDWLKSHLIREKCRMTSQHWASLSSVGGCVALCQWPRGWSCSMQRPRRRPSPVLSFFSTTTRDESVFFLFVLNARCGGKQVAQPLSAMCYHSLHRSRSCENWTQPQRILVYLRLFLGDFLESD